MTIKSRLVTPSEHTAILALSEGHFADLKAIDIKPAKLSRSVSAFANAVGGELFIGIDEKEVGGKKVRTWRGFADEEAANAHLALFDEILPLGDGISCEFLFLDAKRGLVLHVQVDKSAQIIDASDKIAYLRRGAQNLPQNTPEKRRRLELTKGVTSFESETKRIDLAVLQESPILKTFLKQVVPRSTSAEWLSRQNLVRKGNPTVAAILLYAEEPQAALPKRSAIKLYRYKTTAVEGSRETLAFDPMSIEGCLYNQIKSAVSETRRLVEGIQVLGTQGLENVTYPEEALHEIITNAVIHRDYSIAADIHIRIFDNRIEVESPGSLPGHVSVANILSEQFARNAVIVRLINKFPNPPNKDVGEGLNTAFQAMKKLKLKEPTIEERDNSVLVRIRHERLASPEAAVMEYLQTHDEITNRLGRDLTGITSENVMKEVFYRLKDLGQIERVPEKKGAKAAWCKTKCSPGGPPNTTQQPTGAPSGAGG